MRKKLFLVFLVLVLITFFGFREIKNSLWDGKSRLNFVLNNFVFSLEPEKSLTILSLPVNLYLEVPHGYGQYQLGSVYELGQLENRGEELLKETIQQNLAIPVEAYGQMINDQCSMLNCFLFLLQGRGETDLSRWDLVRLWLAIRKLRADKITEINLQETATLKELKLPDESIVLETEFTQLDSLIQRFFSDRQIREEALKIEILNATEQPGLANQLARLINNIGGGVISINNAESASWRTKVKITNEEWKDFYTVKKLEKILGIEAEVGEMENSRADLLIILGTDYWQKWYN